MCLRPPTITHVETQSWTAVISLAAFTPVTRPPPPLPHRCDGQAIKMQREHGGKTFCRNVNMVCSLKCTNVKMRVVCWNITHPHFILGHSHDREAPESYRNPSQKRGGRPSPCSCPMGLELDVLTGMVCLSQRTDPFSRMKQDHIIMRTVCIYILSLFNLSHML